MDLFARLRDRLIDGSLWPRMDGQVYASAGTGAECSVCDQPITADDVEYDVAGPTMIVRVHVACYQAWSGVSARPDELEEGSPLTWVR